MKKELNENEQALIKAVSEGSFEMVVSALTAGGVDIDCADEHGMTPLQHACYKGNVQIAKYLLQNGADVNHNNHEHRYSALMFAALGGYGSVVNLLLEHGANVHQVNTVGRNASQMAAFVGQHQMVAIINNYLPRDMIEHYSKISGLEKEPRLSASFVQPLHTLVRSINIHPVRVGFFLKMNPLLVMEKERVSNVLEDLSKKLIRCNEPKEMLSMKVHYLNFSITFYNQQWKKEKAKKFKASSLEKVIERVLKSMVTHNEKGFAENLEMFLRESIRSYQYQENSIFQQLVSTLASVQPGEDPSALSLLTQLVHGKSVESEYSAHCLACGELSPTKRCANCKMATYCDHVCQKLHWSVHKSECDDLKKAYQENQRLAAKEKRKKDQEGQQQETSEDILETSEETKNGYEKITGDEASNHSEDVFDQLASLSLADTQITQDELVDSSQT